MCLIGDALVLKRTVRAASEKVGPRELIDNVPIDSYTVKHPIRVGYFSYNFKSHLSSVNQFMRSDSDPASGSGWLRKGGKVGYSPGRPDQQ